ncbi:MAG TPA: sigma-70 family RNA polymerase sigma factor [Bacillota bacterium]|nr:sigma-70 family RNA polymerase sigma factor [Bacillota bacterium]
MNEKSRHQSFVIGSGLYMPCSGTFGGYITPSKTTINRGGGKMKTIPVPREKLDALYFTSESFMSKYCQDNSEQIAKMKKIIKITIKEYLTERQRLYLKMYYFNGMTMEKIAQEFGVTKGTVSRTIKKAIENIKKSDRVVFAAKLYGRS